MADVKKFPLYLTPAEQIAVRIVENYRKRHKALVRLHTSNEEYDKAKAALKKAEKEHEDAVAEWHEYEKQSVILGGELAEARQVEKLEGRFRPIHVVEDILYPKEK